MRIAMFGASGMIGQAVMREALADAEIDRIVSVVRTATGVTADKLVEIVHGDFLDFTPIAARLGSLDACLFCLGVSSAGMKEAEYRRITYDVTLAAAKVLLAANPAMTMVYVTGVGTDSTERKRSMWARVKGATENALLAMPWKAAYMIRPAYIQPRHGVRSRSTWTRRGYAAVGWMYPLWRLLAPGSVTTSDELARGMLQAAKHGAPKPILETRDVRALAKAALPAVRA